ncbi:zinc-binding dehydrogenase [Streptomyces sp. NPDC014724]|uniref:zinc-binding dehydrogenase n=1 Tax=unclassified Streptomyces TaxID=2593676 RepID=UPI0036FF1445
MPEPRRGTETTIRYAGSGALSSRPSGHGAELTGGKGAQVIFDPVDGPALADLVKAAAHETVIVLHGVLDPTPTPLNTGEVLFKHLTIRGFELFEITTDDRRRAKAVAFVSDGLAKGELAPVIDKTFPLEAIADAHRYLEPAATCRWPC